MAVEGGTIGPQTINFRVDAVADTPVISTVAPPVMVAVPTEVEETVPVVVAIAPAKGVTDPRAEVPDTPVVDKIAVPVAPREPTAPVPDTPVIKVTAAGAVTDPRAEVPDTPVGETFALPVIVSSPRASVLAVALTPTGAPPLDNTEPRPLSALTPVTTAINCDAAFTVPIAPVPASPVTLTVTAADAAGFQGHWFQQVL